MVTTYLDVYVVGRLLKTAGSLLKTVEAGSLCTYVLRTVVLFVHTYHVLYHVEYGYLCGDTRVRLLLVTADVWSRNAVQC